MKRNLLLMASAWMFTSLTAFSQTNENFNSRTEASLDEVKSYLQGRCWTFSNFNISSTDWSPVIEGDGSVVSAAGLGSGQFAGIYTPMLEIPGYISISFKYTFNNNTGANQQRWFKIFLVNADHEIQAQLDEVVLTNISNQQEYSYSKAFGAGSGLYKVYIQYGGNDGGNTRIGIDELEISANTHYTGGCNIAPVAENDVINGNANRHASGTICHNDYDPNGENFDCYLITNSPDGTVTINPDKTFSFTPNPGFSGSSTSFTYQICDNGFGSLCSNIATVTINFPTGSILPVSMIDFSGLYKNDGNVEVKWTTTFEENSDRFEVERSLNGTKWEKAGTVAAQGTSAVKKHYNYIDNAGRNTANKKDLYYRLKMVDKDGKVSVSRILVVRVYNSVNTKMISVSPNPARNDIAATIQLNQSSVVVLKVLSGNGTEVMRKTLKLGEGNNSVIMDGTSKLNPGLYVLEVVVNGKERMLVKLIKE